MTKINHNKITAPVSHWMPDDYFGAMPFCTVSRIIIINRHVSHTQTPTGRQQHKVMLTGNRQVLFWCEIYCFFHLAVLCVTGKVSVLSGNASPSEWQRRGDQWERVLCDEFLLLSIAQILAYHKFIYFALNIFIWIIQFVPSRRAPFIVERKTGARTRSEHQQIPHTVALQLENTKQTAPIIIHQNQYTGASLLASLCLHMSLYMWPAHSRAPSHWDVSVCALCSSFHSLSFLARSWNGCRCLHSCIVLAIHAVRKNRQFPLERGVSQPSRSS